MVNGNVIDMTTKRWITAGALVILGAAQIPMVGPVVSGFLSNSIGPVSLGVVVGGIAVVSGILLIKKEM